MNKGKFLLTLTKGNERKILAVCETKAAAMEEGNEFLKHLTMDAGTLSVIFAELDDKNNIQGGKYLLYHVW